MALTTEITSLRNFLTELVAIGDAAFSRPYTFDRDNDLAFMTLTFAGRQIEHARSVLVLGSSLDTALIARSMLEGLSQLLWASQEPEDRPLRWRAFVYV